MQGSACYAQRQQQYARLSTLSLLLWISSSELCSGAIKPSAGCTAPTSDSPRARGCEPLLFQSPPPRHTDFQKSAQEPFHARTGQQLPHCDQEASNSIAEQWLSARAGAESAELWSGCPSSKWMRAYHGKCILPSDIGPLHEQYSSGKVISEKMYYQIMHAR